MIVGRTLPRAVLFGLAAIPGLAEPSAPPAAPLPIPVEEVVLDNGLRLLLAPRPGAPLVAAGWAVASGSADDRPGTRGAAHLLEHMLFQGTGTIGVRDRSREERIHRRQDRLFDQWLALDSGGAEPLQGRERELISRIESLETQARELALPGEYSLLYAQRGATGLGAVTFHDFGLYTVLVPANRVELWFWLESDRLLDPVFRELAREKRVIEEERRQMTVSSSAAELDRSLEEIFWGADHPYSADTLGRPREVSRLSRTVLTERYRSAYRPDRLTLALVGGFDPGSAKRLAESYFGRLTATATDPATASRQRAAPAPPPPLPDVDEVRLETTYDGPAKVRLLHRSVAWGHPDRPALDLLAAVLNGRSGRLHRDLVLDDESPVFAAWAVHQARRLGGSLAVDLEVRGDHRPEELLPWWRLVRDRLLAEAPSAEELLRARQRLLADGLRELEEPAGLLRQILIYGALGSWRETLDWPAALARVTPEKVHAVARACLGGRGRVVAFYRDGGPGARDAPTRWRPLTEPPSAGDGRAAGAMP